MVMISVSRHPKKLILEQHLCIIIPITLSDTITLRGCTHKEGLELEFEAKAQNKCGMRALSLMSPVAQKQVVTCFTNLECPTSSGWQ